MGEVVQSFQRGLAVIRSFSADTPAQTLSDVARATGLNRATARRLLLTLEGLGYVRSHDALFQLTPKILELGYAFVASSGVPQLALPYLEQLSAEVNESSSVAVLDETSVVYVARVPAKRVMTVSIGLGSRFPAYRTSLGRVMLAALTREEVERVWERSDRSDPTSRTVTSLGELLARLEDVRQQGWAMVDQELEMGVRSLAAPLRNAVGETLAAVNVSTHVSRTPKSELHSRFLPALLGAAEAISDAIANHPVGLAPFRPLEEAGTPRSR